MVDFSLGEKDIKVIEELRKEAEAIRKHARYYDAHEDELSPDAFPEAADFDHIELMSMDRGDDGCSSTVFGLIKTMEKFRGDFMNMRVPNFGLGNATLFAVGTKEQQQKWGGIMLAMANTEPGCGSDSKAIEMTAVLEGDEWVLNGEKIFVTSGIRAKGCVVWATLDSSAGPGAIKAFIVMENTPGYVLAKKEKKMGIRCSDTAAFLLKDCRIPRENLLGLDETIKQKSGGGFKGLMKTFDLTRPIVAAMGIGAVQACRDFVIEELKKAGVEVDWELGQHKRSAVQQKLIELEAELEAATLVTFRSGWLADKGLPNSMDASLAKAKGGDVSRHGAQLALEILGASGITEDYLIEKWFRDARITDIYEGSAEIQRLVIARALLNYSSKELR